MRKTLLCSLLVIIILGMYLPGALASVSPAAPGIKFQAGNQVLQVWFDAAPQLTIAYPPAYLFNVAAKTASNLTITSLFWNFGDGSTLNVPFSGENEVSDIRAHQYATNQNYCVTVTATDSAGNTASAGVTLMPNFEFTLSAPQTINVTQGGSGSFNVTVGPGPVACGIPVYVCLTVSPPPPAGIRVILSPPCGNTPFTSTVEIQTSTSTPQGTYIINIVGNSTGVAHITAVSVTVAPPYFKISASPNSLTISGQSNSERTSSSIITIHSFNGFNSPVTLSGLAQPPSAMSMSFSNSNPTPPANGLATSTLTITAPCDVPAGTYTIFVQGTSGNLQSQTAINVNVNACPAPPFNFFWWILFGGLIGLLIVLPFLFLLFRRRRVVPIPPPPVPVPIPVPVVVAPPPPPPPPPVPLGYCDVCGGPLIFMEQYRTGYCPNCMKAF